MPAREEPYWNWPAAQLLDALGTGDDGLSASEAAARLRREGANAVDDQPQLAALRLLLRQLDSPLVLILVFGGTLSLVL